MNDKTLRIAILVTTLIGLLDSIYLTWSKIANQSVICGTYQGCDIVGSSPYSEVAGVPVALLGVGAYLAILVLTLSERWGDFYKEYAPMAVFGISLAGTIYSAYLTYLEIWVIHAICLYCVVSAITITLILILSGIRVFRFDEPLEEGMV